MFIIGDSLDDMRVEFAKEKLLLLAESVGSLLGEDSKHVFNVSHEKELLTSVSSFLEKRGHGPGEAEKYLIELFRRALQG